MMKHPNVMARYEVDKFFKIAYHIRRERCTPSQTEYEIDAVLCMRQAAHTKGTVRSNKEDHS